VGQLNFEGLEMATSKDVVVCSIKMTRAATMSTDTETAEEGEAAAEGEGEGEAAPAEA
jgi:large subunit ribosomal protein L25